MPKRLLRSLSSLCAALALAEPAAFGQTPEYSRTVVVSSELKVAIAQGDLVYLFAKPLPGEGVEEFAGRFSDNPQTVRRILKLDRQTSVLKPGNFVRLPFDLLSDNSRKIALEALFPGDVGSADGWTHIVSASTGTAESLWRIAEWFTGDGANYAAIRRANGLASLMTEKGQRIKIPVSLLLSPFRIEAAAEEAPAPSSLSFGTDAQGRYAAYRLKKGEALYSAVVVRFTGLLHAVDVNAEAEKVAKRSGIADVHSIPVGFEVRLPQEDLLPEYRPADDPERIEYERSRLETSQFVNRVRSVDLSGVTVILDPGHGGRDTGALVEGVAEARYVYDVAQRVAAILRRHSKARVILTVEDRKVKEIDDADHLQFSDGGQVMTSPPYPIDDTVPGVHLRWYLSNSILKSAGRKESDPARVLFLSLHADSLHPTVRGAMVYIPGERYTASAFGKSGSVYEARREYRLSPRVSFTRRQRLEAEGVSRELAEKIVGAFRQRGLPVHAYNPVRDNVIRNGHSWVPAVIRYCAVPARALLEVCNLNNDEDRALIQTRTYRDSVARGVVEAIVDYYGGGKANEKTAAIPRRAGNGVKSTDK